MKRLDPAVWHVISPLFDRALDLEADARRAFLDALRATDATAAEILTRLLASHERLLGSTFLDTPALADIEPDLAGSTIGAYTLDVPLGAGGMGVVWKAHRSDGRYEGAVALKLLQLAVLERHAEATFTLEGTLLARLSHPNIARLLDAGVTAAGQPYLVLEYVEGTRLDTLAETERLDVPARLGLLLQVCDAVAHAHAHLVLHRDLKPSNVLVDGEGRVKLLDFGIGSWLDQEGVRAAPAGALRFTPDYAAPEQVQGGQITTATDVYALGVLAHVLLTGRHPFNAAPDAPAGRTIDADLALVVSAAMQQDPAARYAAVTAFADDLRRYLALEPIAVRTATTRYRVSRFVRRHRGGVAAAALFVVAVLAGLAGTITQARRAERESERARQEAATARAERDRALEAQRNQRGTNEFLQLVMRDAATGDAGALRRQLDRVSVLLDKTEFETPVVKIGLLRQTAARYGEIAAWGEGLALMRKAQALVVGPDLAGPGSAVPVNLACSVSRYAYELGDLTGALAELDRADRHLAAGAVVGVPSRVECQLYRSYIELGQGQFERALTTTREAMQALEASGTRSGEQHRIMRSALARALLSVGRTAEALAIADPLLAESDAGQGRQSMAVIRRSVLTTMVRRAGGQPQEAWSLARLDGAAVDRLLGAQRRDLQTDLERGRVLMALGRHQEAADVLDRAVQAGRAAGPTLLLPTTELVAAEAHLRLGQTERAQALLAASTTATPETVAARPERIEALRVGALLARARGARARAGQLLESAQQMVDANGGNAHPSALGVALARSELALENRQPALALKACERALAAARLWAIDKDRSIDVGRLLGLRARIHAGLGQTAESDADRRAAVAHEESSRGLR